MTEQQLRALVREAVARHLGRDAVRTAGGVGTFRQHPSHQMLMQVAGGDAEGPCLIEPSVLCNHCGYCKSLGH